MRNLILIVILTMGLSTLNGQTDTVRKVRCVIVDGDTIPVFTLPNFIFFGKLSPEERRERILLVNRVRTVLPYAKMAAFRLQMMEQNLQQIGSRKAKKEYIKETEKQLKEEFTEQLKNLSINQGKILVKLIHRETGNTVYELLSDYSGRAETFFWNTFSKFYDSDLDARYDPVEDYKIEQIIKSLGLE
jgi:hypothetical protein